MTRRRHLPAIIDDQAHAAEITDVWVGAVRDRFAATFSREWLEATLRRELRTGNSLAFVVKVVDAGDQGDEIADAALREVGGELIERREGRLGEGQIIAYAQRALLRDPAYRGRGNAWYDDWMRNIGVCILVKLAGPMFGVHTTRSLESRRPGRPPSAISLVTEALARNGIHIDEKTVQKHLWFGLPGELVRWIKDDPMVDRFYREWAAWAPFLKDWKPSARPKA